MKDGEFAIQAVDLGSGLTLSEVIEEKVGIRGIGGLSKIPVIVNFTVEQQMADSSRFLNSQGLFPSGSGDVEQVVQEGEVEPVTGGDVQSGGMIWAAHAGKPIGTDEIGFAYGFPTAEEQKAAHGWESRIGCRRGGWLSNPGRWCRNLGSKSKWLDCGSVADPWASPAEFLERSDDPRPHEVRNSPPNTFK